jgi:methyltransferase (TIGR00027 family)
VLIKDGFDTARLVASYRAAESERPGGLIHDPYARHLAGERGAELMRTYARSQEEVWAIAMRTRIYDEILLHRIEQEQIDTVINLAAGLDARPYRLKLPTSLRWIEVDLDALLKYKAACLANEQPACVLERVPLDITNDAARKALLSEISEHAKQIFILTEGLLIYLRGDQVAAIARDLNEQAAIGWWLTEFMAPAAFKKDAKSWNKIATDKTQVRFSPANGAAFFQEYGWNVAEFHSAIEVALNLHVPVRHSWLLRLLMRFASNQPGTGFAQTGFVLLERASRLCRDSD